ncbi:MAG: DNA alkylation repair protein [Nakamurella sp.]
MGAMDELINAGTIRSLTKALQSAAPGFTPAHLKRAARQLDGLKLRARTDLVAAALLADLPADYRAVAGIYRKALNDPTFSGWMLWPVTETVTTLALAAAEPSAFDDGLLLLSELTPRLTSEFAIRRFLAADLERSLAIITGWTADPDPAIRRLASEGTRSFLPWAIRVQPLLEQPAATVPIIDALYRDDDDVVRRSVANHLNDLSRESPDLVADIATRWLTDPAPTTRQLVRHGLRTLVKKGHPAALALLGFGQATIQVGAVELDRATVTAPGDLSFGFAVSNGDAAPVTLAIDYVVDYLKSNGEHREKVFKLATRTLVPGETVQFSKKHAFRPMTTRVHYAGEHHLQLQINGQRYPGASFRLII